MAYFGQYQTPREEWPVLGLRVAYFDGQHPFFRVISQTDPLPTWVVGQFDCDSVAGLNRAAVGA
jgi:hypothetical protein